MNWNQLAALENAIASQYGQKATQNPKTDWNEEKEVQFQKDRKEISSRVQKKKSIKDIKLDETTIVSANLMKRESLDTCTKCGAYSHNTRDGYYLYKYHICWSCYLRQLEG